MIEMVRYVVGFFNSQKEYQEIRIEVEKMENVCEETIQVINNILMLKTKMDIEKITDIIYIDEGEIE